MHISVWIDYYVINEETRRLGRGGEGLLQNRRWRQYVISHTRHTYVLYVIYLPTFLLLYSIYRRDNNVNKLNRRIVYARLALITIIILLEQRAEHGNQFNILTTNDHRTYYT